MNNNNCKIIRFEKALMGIGFLFGAYIGSILISPLHQHSPSLIKETLMILFGGFVGAGAVYLITGAVWLIVKLAIHCKNLLQVPSEE